MPASIFPMTSSTGAGPGGRPSFRRMSRSLSADPDIPLVVLNVRRFHAEAYKYISEALKIDEEGGKKVCSVSRPFICSFFSIYGQVWWETNHSESIIMITKRCIVYYWYSHCKYQSQGTANCQSEGSHSQKILLCYSRSAVFNVMLLGKLVSLGNR